MPGDIERSLPVALGDSLRIHVQQMQECLASGFRGLPQEQQDRDSYRDLSDAVLEMSDSCHRAWARRVLDRHEEAAQILEALTAMMIGVGAASGGRRISEGEVMGRLYDLDVRMNIEGVDGSASDWYELRRAYQTEEHWVSPLYVETLRRLTASSTVSAQPSQSGTMIYQQDMSLYEWGIDRLSALVTESQVEKIVVSSYAVAHDASQRRKQEARNGATTFSF